MKSAVIAPSPTEIPLKTDFVERSTIIAVTGPGGPAREIPRRIPRKATRKKFKVSPSGVQLSESWIKVNVFAAIHLTGVRLIIKPDLTGKETLLEYLECSPQEMNNAFNSAQKVIEYVHERLGESNYWQVSYNELGWLYAGVHTMRGPFIAETGVGPGSTTTAILEASKPFRGKLFSFDLGIKYGESEDRPVGFLVPEDLKDRWTLVLGDTKKTLSGKLSYFGPFDVFFHDSEHTYDHVAFELETAYANLRKKFLIVVDNFDWTEAPIDFAKKYDLNLINVADDMCFIFPR